MSGGPLEGLLVADFSRVLAGPMATMMLADMGARVIKVERPSTGDDTRSWGPPFTDDGSTYFASVNRGKESITLDLTDPADRACARELALRADVLVENFKPGTLERLGLDPAALRAENPGLVSCSITGFGSGGGRDLLGYDFIVQASGGLMSITGEPDGAPMKVGVALVDVLTGKDAVIGILAALAARTRTGKGSHLEVSLMSSALAALVNQGQAYLSTGRSPKAMGNQHPSIAPYETLRCADGLVAVAVGNDGQFRRFATALEVPETADDARFRTNSDRVAHRAELVALLESRLSSRPVAEWVARLEHVGVPAGPVNTIEQAVARAEQLGLRPTITLEGGQRQIRHPITWPEPPPITDPPPKLGADNDAVRAWLNDEPRSN